MRYTINFGYTRGKFSRWTDVVRAVGRVATCFIYLSGAARASAARIWRCAGKNKRLLLTGMRRPAEWRGSWAQIQRPAADLLATSFSPMYFSLRPGFTATLSSKRSENNIESRATIGFNSIVHKEHISPLLPFATTPHRACCGVPPSPLGRGDAPWNMIADSMRYSVA
jgi:hypothetical protein